MNEDKINSSFKLIKNQQNSYKTTLLSFAAALIIPTIASGAEVTCSGNHCYGNQVVSSSNGNANANSTGNTYSGVNGNYVYGAAAQKDGGTGNVVSNGSLTLQSGSKVNNEAYGADSQYNTNSGGEALVTSGELTINSATVGSGFATGANSVSQYSNATAQNGTLTTTSSTISGDAYGSRVIASQNSGNGIASATGTATLNNSTTIGKNAYGASATGKGGATAQGALNINSNSKVTGNTYGAYATTTSGKADANGTVNIANGNVTGGVYGGYANTSGNAGANSNGEIFLNGATVGGEVLAGASLNTGTGNSTAAGKVTIVNSSVSQGTRGSYANINATTTANAVSTGSIDAKNSNLAKVEGTYIYNGGQGNSQANGNVTIADSNATTLYGANIYNGQNSTATGIANINNTSIANDAYGAKSSGTNNSTAIGDLNATGSTINGNLYGANANGANVVASGNLNLANTTVGGTVYGANANGGSGTAKADANVTISNSNTKAVYGAYGSSLNTQASGNVNISNSNVSGLVTGALSSPVANANVKSNGNVNINGSQVNGTVTGGDSSFTNNKNATSISSGNVCIGDSCVEGSTTTNLTNGYDSVVKGNIYGAYASNSSNESNTTSNNLIISNSSIGNGSGNKLAGSYSVSDNKANATTNSFTIKDGSNVNSTVYGSYASGQIANSSTNSFTVSNSGTKTNTINSSIFSSYSTSSSQNANANTITSYIYDGSIVNGSVYGSYADANSGTDANSKTGTLAIANTANSNASNTVNGDIFGSWANANIDANASTDTFYIANSTIGTNATSNNLVGAYAVSKTSNASATLDSNFTLSNGVQADGNITGSYALSNINGNATADSQNIFISGSQIGSVKETTYLLGSFAQADQNASATTESFRLLNGSVVDSVLFGSYAYSINANANSSTNLFSINNINDNNTNVSNGNIYGAFAKADNGTANSNVERFYINNASIGNSVNSSVIGAYAKSSKDASATLEDGNFTIVGNSLINGNVYSAYAESNANAIASSQNVFIGNSTIGTTSDNNLSGSFAISNSANALASTEFFAIYDGSEVNATIMGSYAQANSAEANATTDIFAIANKTGGNEEANNINKDAFGSYAVGDSANAKTNEVYISNSSIGYNKLQNNLVGAYASANNGNASAIMDDNFTVTNGSYIDGNVTGSYALSTNAQANANTGNIFIVGSTLGNDANPTYLTGSFAQSSQDATSNTDSFRILNGAEVNSVLFGSYGYSLDANALANTGLFSINNINNDTTSNIHNGNIYSAFAKADNGSASATTGDVYISNANIGNTNNSSVAGAYADSKLDANANFNEDDNTFAILESSVNGNIYATYANSSNAIATANSKNIYFGNSTVGSSSDILAGSFANGANGANSSSSFFAIYDGAKINSSNVYGAYANSTNGAANTNMGIFAIGNLNNSDANSINGNIYASWANSNGDASATVDQIYVSNTNISGNLTGAYANSQNGSASAKPFNEIQILDGSTIDGDLIGAYASANNQADASADILISNSKLGTKPNSVTGDITGSYASSKIGDATSNSNIAILNTTIEGSITGSYASSPTNAQASNNSVTLQDSTVNGNIYLGSISGNGSATNNTLNIYSGNTINSDEIWGGYQDTGISRASSDLVKGNTFNYYAGANPITVKKLRNFDTYNIEAWGQGVQLFDNDKNSAFITVTDEIGNDSLTSNGNYKSTINVFNSGITFADNQYLAPGDKMYLINAENANIVNGNNMNDAFTLGNNSINVGLIYKADIQISQDSDNSIYAQITNPIPREDNPGEDIWDFIGNEPSYNNTANAGKQDNPPNFDRPEAPDQNKPDNNKNPIDKNPTNPDENLTLPDNPVNNLKPSNPDENVTIPTNPIDPNGNNGNNGLTIDKNAVDRLKPALEGRLASLMAVNKGSDLIANTIWNNIKLGQEGDIIPFGAFEGSHDRYNSGSHVKSNGYTFAVGSGYSFTNSLVGWFFEYGKGNYDTYNNFAAYDRFSALNFKASGKTTHYGIGLLGKTYLGNAYLDGSLRYGKVKNKFDTNSFTDANYRAVNPNYNTDANYYGGHVGAGYILKANAANSFDTSVKYLYNQVEKNSAAIDASKLKFDKSTSSRIQVGEEYKLETNKYLTLVAGVAYEYEFDGKAKGSIDGNKIKSPSAKGSTGIGKLGVTINPFNGGDKNKAIDFGVTGYTGKHEGVSGNINLRYNF